MHTGRYKILKSISDTMALVASLFKSKIIQTKQKNKKKPKNIWFSAESDNKVGENKVDVTIIKVASKDATTPLWHDSIHLQTCLFKHMDLCKIERPKQSKEHSLVWQRHATKRLVVTINISQSDTRVSLFWLYRCILDLIQSITLWLNLKKVKGSSITCGFRLPKLGSCVKDRWGIKPSDPVYE